MQGQTKTIDIKVILEQLRIPLESFEAASAVPNPGAFLPTTPETQKELWNVAGAFFSLDIKKRDARCSQTP
ncbi:hypothetical protein ACHHV8_27775 [Paenibacillus sp. TAB 01]|uniref:hypothetical protein n=1 Tax=Paenibacillus sp. TAB 01 TaxID=3368988 RepID=UPI00375398F3